MLATIVAVVGDLAGFRCGLPPPVAPLACVDVDAMECFVRVEGRRFMRGEGAIPSDFALPPVETELAPFWLQQSEYPVRLLERCLAEGHCDPAGVGRDSPFSNVGHRDRWMMPANGLSYDAAVQACAFLGARLPTADEWEAAARFGSVESMRDVRHPVDCTTTWFLGACHEGGTRQVVGVAGPFSFAGMAGNVLEWVSTSDAGSNLREARGGSWSSLETDELRPTRRYLLDPSERADDVGVRCALDADALTPAGTP